MKRFILLSLFLCLQVICFAQNQTRCRIYQFEGVDSLNRKLVSEEIYNAKGQKVFCSFDGYQIAGGTFMVNVRNYFYYKDTILVLSTSQFKEEYNDDSTKTKYIYNRKKQLVKEIEYDYEKEKKWRRTISDVIYKYNDKGDRISKEKKYHFIDRYEMDYDEKHRVVEERQYQKNMILMQTINEYNDNGYKETIINYDYDKEKQVKQLWSISIFKFNSQRNLIEELRYNKDGILSYTRIFEYNKEGKISKKIYSHTDNGLILTHVYVYSNE